MRLRRKRIFCQVIRHRFQRDERLPFLVQHLRQYRRCFVRGGLRRGKFHIPCLRQLIGQHVIRPRLRLPNGAAPSGIALKFGAFASGNHYPGLVRIAIAVQANRDFGRHKFFAPFRLVVGMRHHAGDIRGDFCDNGPPLVARSACLLFVRRFFGSLRLVRAGHATQRAQRQYPKNLFRPAPHIGNIFHAPP